MYMNASDIENKLRHGTATAEDLEKLDELYSDLDTPPSGVSSGGLKEDSKEDIDKLVATRCMAYYDDVACGDIQYVEPLKVWSDADIKDAIEDPSYAESCATQYLWRVIHQEGNSCASASLCAAIELLFNYYKGGFDTKLNYMTTYNVVTNYRNGGSSLAKTLALAIEQGMASEAVWDSKRYRDRIPEEALEDAKNYRITAVANITNEQQFRTALACGMPVYFGYAGHAILATELLGMKHIRYINSWGSSWGKTANPHFKGGFGILPFSRWHKRYGAYAILGVTANAID